MYIFLYSIFISIKYLASCKYIQIEDVRGRTNPDASKFFDQIGTPGLDCGFWEGGTKTQMGGGGKGDDIFI